MEAKKRHPAAVARIFESKARVEVIERLRWEVGTGLRFGRRPAEMDLSEK